MTIGSLRALGLTTFLLSIPIGIIATLLATRDPFQSPEVLAQWIAIGLISQTVMGAVMFAGYQVCRQQSEQRQRIGVIAAVVLAGAARGAVIAALTSTWELAGTTSAPFRILSSTGTFAAWLLLIGGALHANDRYRSQLAGLLRELMTSELITRAQTFTHPDARDDTLHAQVREQAAAIRDALDASAIAGNPNASARALRREIDERLRPLSHALWRQTAEVTNLPQTNTHFLSRALRTRPRLTWIAPLLVAGFIVNSMVWNGFPTGLFIGVTFSVVYVAVLLVGYHVPEPISARRTVTIAVALLVAPATALWVLAHVIGFEDPNASLAAMAVAGVVILGFFVLARTAVVDRSEELAQLRSRIDAQVLDEHMQVERHRQQANRTAGFLHNTVQARLTAAVLQLERAGRTGDAARTHEALAQADAALALAIEFPGGPAPIDVHQRLAEISEAWAGIAEVTVSAALDQANATAWLVATEAIEEAVANAVRHGGATAVAVAVRNEHDHLLVTVQDNGSGAGKSGGMGAEWMGQVTAGHWERTRGASGSVLTLRLPRSAPAGP